MVKEMNLAEEYIMRNKGVIILISGLSGSSRTVLAKEIERDFKLKLFSLEDYCKKDNEKVFVINSETKIIDWEHIDVYDWDGFNKDVKESQEKGVVVYGDYFPEFKLDFKSDFHVHIKMSKKMLIEKRKEYIEKHPEKCAELLKLVENNTFDLVINKVTYPYYLEYRDKSKIDKFISSDENTSDQIYDQTFDFIIFGMRKFLNEYYSKKHHKETPTKTKETEELEETEETEETEEQNSDDSIEE